MSNNKNNFQIAKDGVAMIYADKVGASQVYMGNSSEGFDDSVFNVSYGKKSHIDYEQKKDGKLNFYQTEGSPINYHSGSESGRSTRIDTYPGGGMWTNKTDFSWEDNPGYLYNKKGTLNSEFTTYIRVHGSLGTHQAYAHKKQGRDEDAIRSLAEMVYPTAGKNEVTFNYNYAHFPYVHAKAKNLEDLETFGDDWGWLALKTINIVKDDYTHWEMWADFDPIAKDGSINNNWEKIAEFKDEGCDEYNNVSVTWRCHKQVCRVDGFSKVDFALFSDREIDPTKLTSTTVPKDKPVKVEQTKPVFDCKAQSGLSTDEFLEAEQWLKDNPKAAVTTVINKIAEKLKYAGIVQKIS